METMDAFRQSVQLLALVGAVGLVGPALAGEIGDRAEGDYAEARTCDVWTGPCFANGEVNLRGDHAVMAWSVSHGTVDGVGLDGLRVVVSIDAEGTLGAGFEGRVRAVVFVDDRASERQAEALVSLVKQLAPRHTGDIVKIHRSPITYRRDDQSVRVQVGSRSEVELETTPLMAHCDTICGNETMFYPPIANTEKAACVKTVKHAYRGVDLGPRWSDPNARSAIVGRFVLRQDGEELSRR